MNPSDFASLSSGQVLLPDTSQAEAALGQLVRPSQPPKQPDVTGHRVAAAEREDVNQKLVSALIIPTTTAVRAPVITLNGERANVYGIVERHLRPETLAGPDRFWKSAKILYNLDTWRPRVNGAQLKALQGARLPETEEEWQHVKATLDSLQAWLKDETTPDLCLQDLRGLANFIYGWWDTRNKREGGGDKSVPKRRRLLGELPEGAHSYGSHQPLRDLAIMATDLPLHSSGGGQQAAGMAVTSGADGGYMDLMTCEQAAHVILEAGATGGGGSMAPSNANLSGGPASSDGFPGPTSLPADSNGMANPTQQHRVASELQDRRIIPLNVGGQRFVSTSTTLAASEDSFFSRLLGAEGSQRGEIFIDRCGRLFGHVLEHLRSLRYGETPASLPSNPDDLRALQREAEFYGLSSLTERAHLRLAEIGGQQDRVGSMQWASDGQIQPEWHAVVVTGDTDTPSETAPRLLQEMNSKLAALQNQGFSLAKMDHSIMDWRSHGSVASMKMVQAPHHSQDGPRSFRGRGHVPGGNRLQEVAAFAASEKLSTAAGSNRDLLSFQHALVPLLAALLQPAVTGSLLKQLSNPIFMAFIQNTGFLAAVKRCLLECIHHDRLQDAAFKGRPTSEFHPFSWQHLIAPLVSLVREGMERFVTARHDPDFQRLAQAVQTVAAAKLPDLGSAKDEASRELKQNLRTIRIVAEAASRDTAHQKAVMEGKDHRARMQLLQISISPTMNEALSAGREDIVSYLPANQADAAHHLPQDSIDRGLDIHFRLVRHDNFQPMFKNVQGLLKERQEGAQASGSCTANTKKRPGRLADMPAFYNVSIAQLTPHRQGLMYMLEFDQPKLPKHFRSGKDPFIQFWERSRRLNVGALVCLWVDEEPVRLIFAVVCLRDIKSLTKTIDREVAGSNMLLLEAANDYFSYEPVLKALQASSEATLPFPHLLKLCPDKHAEVATPAYVSNHTTFDLSVLAKDDAAKASLSGVDVLETCQGFGQDLATCLDGDQMTALLACLRQELTLIQGPPGTGKTYIGTRLVQVLTANTRPKPRVNEPEDKPAVGPILVLTYTNHALDQFLLDLIKHGIKGIVRVGGNSKSEALQPFNLHELSKGSGSAAGRRVKWETHQSLERIESDIRSMMGRLADPQVKRFKQIEHIIQGEHPDIWAALSFLHEYQEGWNFASRTDILQTWLHPPNQNVHASERNAASKQKPILTRPNTAVNPYEALADVPSSQAGDDAWVDVGADEPLELEQEAEQGAWATPEAERWTLYQGWAQIYNDLIKEQLQEAVQALEKCQKQLLEVHDEAKREILAGATIVGITTTGAAKNQELIRRLNCKVVIVEEAAEVLEAHILVNLTASNEQLVLIGDHRQLRPKTQANYAFGAEKGLGLDVSLFERLVSQHNMPVHQLLVQRRMRPEIADLIRSTIYRDLVDGENVKSYPHVAGMAHNTFFLDHKHKEESEIHTLSHINTWEAHMVAAIAKHLLRQGCYGSEDITVLTPYTGQLLLLRKALEKHTLVFLDEADQKIVDDIDSSGLTGPENPEAASDAAQEPATNICHDTVRRRVRLATVDNFQGEESKVVLVSLVRSNDIGKAGFLNTTNRVNVLLSRAQHGMILVGNADTFCSSKTTPMWRDVIGQL
ncbi:hypothetical protein WJX74_004715 [Apatococcus lobatus]|uniref:BTB domain-containing protein n=1 Tax=Apatococcus lobatus TaxID=904363 RepID=A0AAW1QN56_9CHLO